VQDIKQAARKGKALPKRFRINNVLAKATIKHQTKLNNLSGEQAFEFVKKASITGRQGFLPYKQPELTLKEALFLYKEKIV